MGMIYQDKILYPQFFSIYIELQNRGGKLWVEITIYSFSYQFYT